jgi:hypothetical protein
MLSWLFLVWWVLSPVGFVLFIIGVVLRLCESSWGKPLSGLGSLWFLAIGAFLCAPVAVYFLWPIGERLFR